MLDCLPKTIKPQKRSSLGLLGNTRLTIHLDKSRRFDDKLVHQGLMIGGAPLLTRPIAARWCRQWLKVL